MAYTWIFWLAQLLYIGSGYSGKTSNKRKPHTVHVPGQRWKFKKKSMAQGLSLLLSNFY